MSLVTQCQNWLPCLAPQPAPDAQTVLIRAVVGIALSGIAMAAACYLFPAAFSFVLTTIPLASAITALVLSILPGAIEFSRFNRAQQIILKAANEYLDLDTEAPVPEVVLHILASTPGACVTLARLHQERGSAKSLAYSHDLALITYPTIALPSFVYLLQKDSPQNRDHHISIYQFALTHPNVGFLNFMDQHTSENFRIEWGSERLVKLLQDPKCTFKSIQRLLEHTLTPGNVQADKADQIIAALTNPEIPVEIFEYLVSKDFPFTPDQHRTILLFSMDQTDRKFFDAATKALGLIGELIDNETLNIFLSRDPPPPPEIAIQRLHEILKTTPVTAADPDLLAQFYAKFPAQQE